MGIRFIHLFFLFFAWGFTILIPLFALFNFFLFSDSFPLKLTDQVQNVFRCSPPTPIL